MPVTSDMAGDPGALPAAVLPTWPLRALAGVVVFRASVFAAAIAAGEWQARPNFPAWITLLQLGVFVAPALLLLVAGRADHRAWSLGVYFLDVACTLAEPLVWSRVRVTPPLVVAATALRADAFQGMTLWFFATEFPRGPGHPRLARACRAGFVAFAVIGVGLAGLNTFLPAAAGAFSRAVAGWYFGLQYLAVPILAAVLWFKLRELEPADRRRAYTLIGAIGLMAGSVLLVVLLRGVLGLQLPGDSAAAWAVLFTVAVGVLPAVATYAALVQRVLSISVILRAAAQYLLSKSIVYALAVLPFLAAIVYLVVNREQAVAEVFSGVAGTLLLVSAAAGVALLLLRRRLLDAIDRQFGRRPVQASGPLLDLAGVLRQVQTLEEFTAVTESALGNLFGPRSHGISIADETGHLHSQQAQLPPLATSGALAQLIGGSDEPLIVSFEPGSILSRLNEFERDWLKRSNAALLAPLRGPGGELVGLMYLSERTSELPYSLNDCSALGAIGSTCGLALYGLRVRAREGSSGGVETLDTPARECVECGLLHETDSISCRCGAPLQRAPVPLRLRRQLRFIRRIGTGATGVVYEARDLAVHQARAVKALPETDPALMSRLRHEARTMAAVSHPNLATFYALESWRSAPLLVMEFCADGTLADRLRRGPLQIDQALSICERMAEALEYLHAHGILHRDVKPSNIGFTSESAPKLLDFGLAKFVGGTLGRQGGGDASTYTASLTDTEGAIRGTPAYLSPEVLAGTAPTSADDVWSLSVTLLETCTGENPFKAATPAATAARVMVDDGRVATAVAALPETLARLIRALLDRHPAERPSSAREFQDRIHLVHKGVHHAR